MNIAPQTEDVSMQKKEIVQRFIKEGVDKSIVGSIIKLVVGFVSISIPAVGLVEPFYNLVKAIKRGMFEEGKRFETEFEKEIEGCISDTIERMRIECPEIKEYYLSGHKREIERLILIYKSREDQKAADLFYSITEDVPMMDSTETQRINEEFREAFQKSLFFYPRLNSYLIRIALEELQTKIESTNEKLDGMFDLLNERTEEIVSYIKDELIHKYRVWEHKDGMMHSFAKLFREYYLNRKPNIRAIKYLSTIQDDYNYNYAKYNSTPMGRNIESAQAPFDLIERDTIYKENELLFECYLHFIEADYWYFNKRYYRAIEAYQLVRDDLKALNSNDNRYDKEAIRDAELYVVNSIAWSCHEADRHEHTAFLFKGVEAFKSVFQSEEDYADNLFISIYRRNYGVCLESANNYCDALGQYIIAINLLPDYTDQYKLFTTFCSSLMKEWDRRYKKISDHWVNNIREKKLNPDKWDISCENIEKVKNYLSTAEKIKGNFPDIYIQRTKVLTYELLYSDMIDIERQYAAVDQQLFFAEQFGRRQEGRIFVKRDFCYALFLIDFRGQKGKWIDECEKFNDMLNHKGDADDFAVLIESIKKDE